MILCTHAQINGEEVQSNWLVFSLRTCANKIQRLIQDDTPLPICTMRHSVVDEMSALVSLSRLSTRCGSHGKKHPQLTNGEENFGLVVQKNLVAHVRKGKDIALLVSIPVLTGGRPEGTGTNFVCPAVCMIAFMWKQKFDTS